MQALIHLSEIVRNLGLALAAFGGIVLAWRKLGPETKQAGSSVLQADLARRAHVTELFNRAASQLVDDRLEVRLAAIYVLREVARDFPDLSDPVFELLQAHLRERRRDYGNADLPIDMKAITETIGLQAAKNDER